jgi:hypothetical protein
MARKSFIVPGESYTCLKQLPKTFNIFAWARGKSGHMIPSGNIGIPCMEIQADLQEDPFEQTNHFSNSSG